MRAKKVSLVMGSTLSAGLISGSPRYNYGKENFKIPPDVIQKLARLRAVAQRRGVDLRTAALQLSAAASEAVAIEVGAASERQIDQNWNSMQATIPQYFWSELKKERLIEENAPTPAV